MKRLLALLGALCVIVIAGKPAAAERPNLLVIETDEHNFRTLGCYRALLPREQAEIWGEGVIVETPNIDWLARNGAICDRYYATSPVCTPSRAALVSGLYPQNTGAIRNDLPMHDDVVTFAEVLRRQGYATGYAGKWHLDGPGRPQWTPSRTFGFADNRFMFNRGHWKKLALTADGPRVAASNARGEPTYALDGADERSFTTDFLADRAVDFIRAHAGQPFCYMVSIPDPHGPNVVRPPYDTMFTHLKFRQPRSALAEGKDLPAYAATLPDAFDPHQMALYFGMVKCIDDNVGKILGALRAAGVIEKTFIVFTSDHGDLCGEHGRHNKGVPLEASARIPFVLYAPGVVRPATVVRQALGTVDFKPTLLSLMGIADPGKDRVEGRDASTLFLGREPAEPWKDRAFVRIGTLNDAGNPDNGWMGAFSRRYKLIVAPGAAPALFDLEQDPDELTNQFTSPAHRETVRRLARELSQYARTHNEPLLASEGVRADLDWAENGQGAYVRPKREEAARGRRKAQGKAGADQDRDSGKERPDEDRQVKSARGKKR